MRSPSLDYRSAPTTSSDGQVIGANQVAPNDQLAQGAGIGTRNTFAPGWHLTDAGLVYDPNAPDANLSGHHAKQASR